MAELLILNRDHWMDALTQKQIDEYVQIRLESTL